MEILKIPAEVYMIALAYENLDQPENLKDARKWYACGTADRGWTSAGLEKAIADYLLRENAFAEGGEFEDANGWREVADE